MGNRVMLLVGTKKGLFCFESDEERRSWRESGPHLPSWEVTGLLGDTRHGPRIFAGTGHLAYGPTIRVSDDLGHTWAQLLESPRYTQESGRFVRRIWQIAPGPPSEPDTYYAGVDEAGLFISRDQGRTWQHRDTLAHATSRPRWSRTQAGNPLHSLIIHPDAPQRMWALIGGAGVVYSEDGGIDWRFCNSGLPPAESGPDLTQGVHRLVADPANPERLYVQHTGGTFCSDDGGLSWHGWGEGLPSRFGFALDVSPTRDVYSIPLDPDTRCFVDGRLQIYRRGPHDPAWQPVGGTLPADPYYVGVLRDAFAIDGLEPSGLYFGTTQGDLFISPDAGAGWIRLPGQFSRINTIKAWLLPQ